MQIREARSDESERLTAIARAAKGHWGYSAQTMETWAEALAVSPADIRFNPTFVADDERALLGFYMLSIDNTPQCELAHLWVAPSSMRRGIGRALLTHAAENARTRGATELRIDADPNAEGFYRACGAVRIGNVPAPITEDAKRSRPILLLLLREAGR